MKNNNSAIIRRLAIKHLKANKLRNAFIMSAIVLICLLFTIVFSMIQGIVDVTQTEMMQEAGSDFHAVFEYMDDKQMELISKHPSIKEYSVATTYLIIKDSTVEKKYMKVDDVFWKHAIISDSPYGPFSNIEFVDGNFAENNADPYNELYVVFDNAYFLKLKMNRIVSDTGVDAKFYVNNAYTAALFEEPSSFLPFALPLILIFICGYLLVYNIYHISVVNDVKAYGLLKTVGTTGNQLKRIIFISTNILYFIALPVGLLLGYLIGYLALTPLLLPLSGIDVVMKTSPFPYIFAAIFVYVTMIISIRKPQKIAGSVAPVVAVSYTPPSAAPVLSKHKAGKSNIRNLAWQNLLRNKGRTAFSILSVTFSIIIFAVFFNIFSNISFDAFVNKYFGGDFTVNYIHPEQLFPDNDARITETLIDRVRSINGVTSVNGIYINLFNPVNDDTWGENVIEIYGMPAELNSILSEHRKGILSGKFDLRKWESGDYVILSYYYEYGNKYRAGDFIDIGNPSGKQYEVLLVTDKPIYWSSPLYGNKFRAYIPANEFTGNYLSGIEDAVLSKLVIAIDIDAEASVKTELANIFPREKNFRVSAKSEMLNDLRKTVFFMQAAGYSMTLIIALIGLINMVNTFLANAFSRKIEYALLQSVGMSGKQMKKVLFLESGYCGVIIIGLSFLFGSILSKIFTEFAAKNLDFLTVGTNYSWIVTIGIIMFAALYLLSIAVQKIVTRQTLVERLREAE
jgi:putative ABC transport system permease protein